MTDMPRCPECGAAEPDWDGRHATPDLDEWQPIETAPKEGERFIILYCAEDKSRWLAKWQGGRWYGIDELGLTREAQSYGDPNYVTGWFVNAWMPLPDPPMPQPSTDIASKTEGT